MTQLWHTVALCHTESNL